MLAETETQKEIWVQAFCEKITLDEWVWCEQAWWRYRETGVWERADVEELDYVYFQWCDECGNDAKDYHSDAIKRLKAKLYVRLWKDREATGLTNFQNGVYDHANHELVPHDPIYFLREQLNIPFAPAATPYWDKVAAHYPKEIMLFERVIHAVLTKSHIDECMFFGVGPTGSGKGTISQILGIAFRGACAYTKLNDLGENFMLSTLVGKLINLDREGEIGYLNKRAVSYLKDIVTHEGPMQINAKNKQPYDADLDIWFFTFTNQLYQLPSGTDRKAFFRRVVLAEFDQTMVKDPLFKDAVAKETAAIISKICAKEFERVFPEHMDVDAYVLQVAERWDFWSEPIRRLLSQLFEYSDQPLDELEVACVVDWMDEALRREGINEKNDTLKSKITMYFGLMKIHFHQRNRVKYYFNVKAKDPDLIALIKAQKEMEAAEREDSKGFDMDRLLKGGA